MIRNSDERLSERGFETVGVRELERWEQVWYAWHCRLRRSSYTSWLSRATPIDRQRPHWFHLSGPIEPCIHSLPIARSSCTRIGLTTWENRFWCCLSALQFVGHCSRIMLLICDPEIIIGFSLPKIPRPVVIPVRPNDFWGLILEGYGCTHHKRMRISMTLYRLCTRCITWQVILLFVLKTGSPEEVKSVTLFEVKRRLGCGQDFHFKSYTHCHDQRFVMPCHAWFGTQIV